MHDSRHGRRTQTVFYSLTTTARPPPACLTCALRRSRSLARWPSSPLPSSRPTQAFTHSLTHLLQPFGPSSILFSFSRSLLLFSVALHRISLSRSSSSSSCAPRPRGRVFFIVAKQSCTGSTTRVCIFVGTGSFSHHASPLRQHDPKKTLQ